MGQQVVAVPVPNPVRGPLVAERPRSSWGKARERLAWALVAPSILIVVVVALYPLAQSIRLSFTNARLGSTPRGGERYVGFDQYRALLENAEFRNAFWHTVQFTVASVAIETLLGMVIALIINSQFSGRGLVRTAILIPWAIPTVVSSRLWEIMYRARFGVIDDLLTNRLPNLVDWIPFVGDNLASIFPEPGIAFLADPNLMLPAIVAVDVWKTTPFMALLLLAGLQIIPEDVYEASFIDGASRWQQFWQITLPLLKPALVVALIFRTLDAFRVFDVVYVMKGAALQTQTLAVFAQQRLVTGDRLGATSAASVLIFLCIAIFVVIYTRLVKIEEA